jgi:hypothetical protein
MKFKIRRIRDRTTPFDADKINERIKELNSHKCQKCSNNKGTTELHICPYQTEINDNFEWECNCCDSCFYECAMDI